MSRSTKEPKNDPPNVTRQNFAEQMGVSVITLDRWGRQKKIPTPIKLGKSRNAPIRWRQSAIDAWIEAQESGADHA